MKIVDYETFIRMPAGTVFCEWDKDNYYEQKWSIKTDDGYEISSGRWMFTGVCPLSFCTTEGYEDGCYLPPENVGEYGTDALSVWDNSSIDYEKDQLFCVLDKKEIDDIISWLQWATGMVKGNTYYDMAKDIEDRTEKMLRELRGEI